MTLSHITSYEIDGGTIRRVNLLDYDPDTGEVSRRVLPESDRAGVPGEDFEFVGLAEDYDDPATVWAIYQDIHGDEWGAETVSTSLEELRYGGGGADD